MVVEIWRHNTSCAMSSGAHSGQKRGSRVSGNNEGHTIDGALVRPKVLYELHASRAFLPKLEVPVRGPGQQKLVAGGHCNTGDHVAVHEAALVHGRRWQACQVRCFMRQHLRPRTGYRMTSCIFNAHAQWASADTRLQTVTSRCPGPQQVQQAHRPSQPQILFTTVHCWLPQSHKPTP